MYLYPEKKKLGINIIYLCIYCIDIHSHDKKGGFSKLMKQSSVTRIVSVVDGVSSTASSKQYRQWLGLILRFCGLLLVVTLRGSALILRLFWLRFVARSFLFAGLLVASAALLLGSLPIAVTPLPIIRFVFAASLPILIFGLIRVFGFGRPRFGLGTRASGSGFWTLAARTWTTATPRRPLLALLRSGGWSTWSLMRQIS